MYFSFDRLTKVPEHEYHNYIKDLGFMDIDGFQR
jgi:hypothetical protein